MTLMKENRGGVRPGQGRKPIELSDREKKQLIKAARAKERETGRTVWDILIQLIYEGLSEKTQLTAIRIYQDAVISKQQHTTVEKRQYGLVILPEIMEVPEEFRSEGEQQGETAQDVLPR